MRHRLLASAMIVIFSASSATAEYRLTILHTNDVHSRFGPIDRFDRDCTVEADAAGACYGGAARLATAIAAARAVSEHAILLDAGDQFPGRYSPADAHPTLLAELMNRLGYDAMALGSHEFDEGYGVARRFVEGLGFPALVANAEIPGAPALAGKIEKSTVIERGGERLGFIGLSPVCTDCWTGVDDIVVTDPVSAVQREADRLAADGVDKIIVISHSGYAADKRIAQNTTGIDVIVGGHSHSYLSNTLKPSQGPYPTIVDGVAIVHAFPWGSTLGKLDVTFDDAGTLVEAVGDQVLLDANIAPDADIATLIATQTATPE